MQPLHCLVLALAFLGLFSSEASAWKLHTPENGIAATDPNLIKVHTRSNDKPAFECHLPFGAEDLDPRRIHSDITDFFQRYFNFHWFMRKHMRSDPPALRLKVLDYCYPNHKVCHWLADELPKFVPQAIEDINNWLYTSPYHENTASFCPKYPPVTSIEIHLGLGEFDLNELAHVPVELYPDNTMHMYFNIRAFARLLKEHPKWKVLKLARHVLTHELVHTLQHGTIVSEEDESLLGQICDGFPPDGLVEGMADFVSLKAGSSSPMWPARPRQSDKLKRWDVGYIRTAYFLEWLEDVRLGPGAIARLNDRIGKVGYFAKDSRFNPCLHQPDTWKTLFGSSVTELWEEYRQYVDTHKPYIYHVVEFIGNPITVAVFGTLVFGVLFFPLVWDFVKDLDLWYDVLLAPLYFRSAINWFRAMTYSKFRAFLRQFSFGGFVAVFTTVIFVSMNVALLRDSKMSPIDATFIGGFYSVIMRWMHDFAEADIRARRERSLGRLRGYDLTWELYERILLLAHGIYLAIGTYILVDHGVPRAVTLGFAVLCFIPHFFIQSLIYVIKQCIASIFQLLFGWTLFDDSRGRHGRQTRTRVRTGSYHRRRPRTRTRGA